MDAKQLGLATERIYDTALDPESWPDVLNEIAHYFGATGAMLFDVLEGEKNPRLISPYFSNNYDIKIVDEYLNLFGDYELEDQIKFAERTSRDNSITIANDVDVLGNLSYLETLPHVQYLAGFGIKHRTGTILNKDNWNADRFSLQFRKDQGLIDDDRRELAHLVLPHVSKARRIGRPLYPSRGLAESELQKRFDAMFFGVAVVTQNGEPFYTNREFDRIVSETGCFRVNPFKQIEVWEATINARYRTLLQYRDLHGQGGAYPSEETLVITHGKNSHKHILVDISPAKNHPVLGKLPVGSSLMTAFDSGRSHDLDTSHIARFYKLSPSEKTVLKQLAHGLTNAEIAEQRVRSIETINSQVRSLFKKTTTKSRSELVLLAASLHSPFSKQWLA